MKTVAKILLIIAFGLIVCGAVFFGVGIIMNDGDIPMAKYDVKSYGELGNFNDIYINTTTADILFEKAPDGKAKVVCYEQEKQPHNVLVKDEKLTIEVQDNRKWYDYVGINSSKTAKITVYLPQNVYNSLFVKTSTGCVNLNNYFNFLSIEVEGSTGDVICCSNANDIKIYLSTGDIEVNGITAKNLRLKVSTGEIEVANSSVENEVKIEFSTDDVSIKNLTADNLTVNGETGDVNLSNVIVSGKMNIKASTGEVTLNRCDAGEIKINLSTGDVKASLLSSKIFIVDTNTGKKQVPNTTQGGICEITNSTGDITFTIVS